jgi:transcriptional regulator with XRE-family HTH domain
MVGIGNRLREARLAWRLTLREVEERSFRLAEEWQNQKYRISASWLDRVEREDRALSATKLIVLAFIYGLSADQMFAALQPGSLSKPRLDNFSAPNATQLLQKGPLQDHAQYWLPDGLATQPAPETTTLLPTEQGVLPTHYRRGILGGHDRTLDPMIPAGSIVLIDTGRKVIAARRKWTHEFDRPIYFLVTRTDYLCGFCELDRDAEWLTLVPHPLSFESSRRWRFKKEVEVIGTVAGAFVRRAIPVN